MTEEQVASEYIVVRMEVLDPDPVQSEESGRRSGGDAAPKVIVLPEGGAAKVEDEVLHDIPVNADNEGGEDKDGSQMDEEGDDSSDEESHSEKGRGSDIPAELPHPEDRLEIWMNGDQFSHQKTCTKMVASICKMFRGPWGSWEDVPEKERNDMWCRFKGHFQWKRREGPRIKECWEHKMKQKFRDMLRRARESAFKKVAKEGGVVTDDFSCILPHNPKWLKQEFWVSLVEKLWNTPEWKKLSAQGKLNRAHLVGGPHTCGSRNYTSSREAMEGILGRKLSSREFYTYGHTKKGCRPWEKEGWKRDSGQSSVSEAGQSSGSGRQSAR